MTLPLLKMGYGYDDDSGVVVGGSHDNGIDGVICEDKLGLSRIYLQAKRYGSGNTVGSKEIQSFVGCGGNAEYSKRCVHYDIMFYPGGAPICGSSATKKFKID